MSSSPKYSCMVRLSSWALVRSVPKGFSTMTRAPAARPAAEMPRAIRANSGGGDLEVEQRAGAAAHLVRHRLVRGVVVEVAIDIAQKAEHLCRGWRAGVHPVQA